MTYDDIRAILGRGPVRAVEDAVNEAVIASRLAESEHACDALELLLTTQLAAVIATRSEAATTKRAVDRVLMQVRVLVAEALTVQEGLSEEEMRAPPTAAARTTTLN